MSAIRQHFRNLFAFYFVNAQVVIESRHNPIAAAARIFKLNETGAVRVMSEGNDLLVASSRLGPRANITPLFRGRIEGVANGSILRGTIGIDKGVRGAMLLIGLLAVVFFPVAALCGAAHESFHGASFLPGLILFGLAEYGFFQGKLNIVAIKTSLMRSLGVD